MVPIIDRGCIVIIMSAEGVIPTIEPTLPESEQLGDKTDMMDNQGSRTAQSGSETDFIKPGEPDFKYLSEQNRVLQSRILGVECKLDSMDNKLTDIQTELRTLKDMDTKLTELQKITNLLSQYLPQMVPQQRPVQAAPENLSTEGNANQAGGSSAN